MIEERHQRHAANDISAQRRKQEMETIIRPADRAAQMVKKGKLSESKKRG
jgi:hypothetical protein